MAKNQTQLLNEKAKRNPYLKTSLKYPLDIETEGQQHIILFNINVLSGSKFNRRANRTIDGGGPRVQEPGAGSVRSRTSLSRNTVRIDTSIAMHLPPNLTFAYTTQWGGQELGSAAKAFDYISNWDDVTLEKVIRSAGIGAENIGASLMQQLTPINARDMLDYGRGAIKNPYKELLFSGMNNRTFLFQFKFTPRNQSESEEVKKICDKFKLHQAPEINGKYGRAYYQYPSEFDISFIKKDGTTNEWVNKISTCALTSCEVIFGDEGGYKVHEDDAPVEVSLNLAFMEMEILTKSRIESGDF